MTLITQAERDDIRNVLQMVRVTKRAPYLNKGLTEVLGGAQGGMRDTLASFIHQDTAYHKLHSLNNDQSQKHYLDELRARINHINPNSGVLASKTIVKCLQQDSFDLPVLQQAHNSSSCLEKWISKGASFFGRVARTSTKVTMFIYGYAAIFSTLRLLERTFTGNDRWAEIDQVDESEHLMSQSTINFIFLYLPVISTVLSYGANYSLRGLSAFARQTRLINKLSSMIFTCIDPKRTDFSKAAIDRDQELLSFLLAMNPPPVQIQAQEPHED